MLGQLWQKVMIGLARSEGWKNFMQSEKTASKLASRYVGGSDVTQAGIIAAELKSAGIASSLFYLGEYVADQRLIDRNVAEKNEAIGMLAREGLDIHVSVDPTQVGCALDWEAGAENLSGLARSLTELANGLPGRHCLMLDMEDYSVNESTIALHDALVGQGQKVAITLQAYLRKTRSDMERMIQAGAMVRLVKGAFAEDRARAYGNRSEIKRNYREMIDLMLGDKARETGFYPVFATHDHQLQDFAIDLARRRGWPQGAYEFEMLYGARDDRARDLASKGESIRLYLPFGEDWWPYAVRRIGENPRNALLLARGILGC